MNAASACAGLTLLGVGSCATGYEPLPPAPMSDAPATGVSAQAPVAAPAETTEAAPPAERAQATAQAPALEQAAPAEPFTLALEGTALELEMLPLRLADGRELWMSATEVPWEAFDVYTYGFEIPRAQRVAEFDAATRPSKPYGSPDRGWGHEGYPALSMTAHSAELFCDWLGERTDTDLRLPTVKEWEFAAREGRGMPAIPSLADPERVLPQDLGTAVGWAPANGPRTVALAELEPNALGFRGLLGNLGEWARFDESEDSRHVLCGGHFLDEPDEQVPGRREVQQRTWNQTDPQNPKSLWWLSDAPFVGFRIVATSAPDRP